MPRQSVELVRHGKALGRRPRLSSWLTTGAALSAAQALDETPQTATLRSDPIEAPSREQVLSRRGRTRARDRYGHGGRAQSPNPVQLRIPSAKTATMTPDGLGRR